MEFLLDIKEIWNFFLSSKKLGFFSYHQRNWDFFLIIKEFGNFIKVKTDKTKFQLRIVL